MLHSTGTKNDLATTLAAEFNLGHLRIFTTPTPGTADAAETGTLLVDVTYPNPAYGSASGGVITQAGTPLTGSIVASGTASYCRQVSSTDGGGSSTTDKRLQGTVATSAAECIVNTTSFTNGGTFTLNSGSWTAPS